MDYRHTVKLNELITLAGSQVQLACLLGVDQRVVSDWKRAGQISKIGALLVSKSSLLSDFFNPSELRSDLMDSEIENLKNHTHYITARLNQIEYESRPDFAQTSLFYIQERLGVDKMDKHNGS